MKLSLHDNWKEILKKAWSIRFLVLSIFLSSLEILLPYIEPFLGIPPGVFAALSVLTMILAIVARIVAQKKMKIRI